MPDPSMESKARFASIGAGIAAACIGGYHLFAWLSGFMTYRGLNHITMKTNAALCLLLSAVALITLAVAGESRLKRGVVQTLALVVMTIGSLTVLEHLFGWDLGIDQMLATESPGAVGILDPNRMGPPGAATYAIGGASLLLLLRRRDTAVRAGQWLAVSICLLALMGILGYLYGVKDLYGTARFTVVAFPATIGNFCFGFGLLLARSRSGLMEMVTAPDPGGTTMRRLLPAAVFLPIVLGWLRIQGEWHGLYERYFGTALLILSLSTIFSILIYSTASRIRRLSQDETKAREEAQVQRQLYDAIVANIPAGVLLAHADDLRIILVNEQYKSFAPGKEMLGRTIEEVWPEIQPWFGNVQRQVATTGIPYHAVDDRILLTRSHGAPLEERYFTWATVRVALPGSQGWGVLTTAWETTQRKRNEEELKKARDLLEGVMEGAASNIAALDTDHRFLAMNSHYQRTFAEVFGVEAAVGDRLEELLAHLPEQQATAMTAWQRSLQGETLVIEEQFGLPGRHRHFEIRFSPIKEGDGRILGATQISTDITARKEAEEAVRQSERNFRAVFEQAAVGIARVSFTGARWIDVNPAFQRMLGYGVEEMLATPWPEITHPEDLDLDLVPFRQMAAGELGNYTVEKRFIHKDGHQVWARLTLSLVRDVEGCPDYEIAVIEDITERKKVEIQLRERERLFKTVLETLPVGVWVLDKKGRVLQVNTKVTEIWAGAPFRDLESYGGYRGWWVDSGEPVKADQWGGVRAALKGETSLDEEVEIEAFDGSHKFVLISSVPITNEAGEITGGVTVNQDITRRKVVEAALVASEQRFRGVFTNAAVGIGLFDGEMRPHSANAKLCDILGYRLDELLGHSFRDFIHPDDREPDVSNYQRLMTGELDSYTVEKRYVRKDGSFVWVRVTRSAQQEGQKIPEYTIGVIEDISARKEAEENQHRLLAEVQRSNQDLQQFAYVASHDLQEPLRMVSSYMQLLERRYKEQLDEKAQTFIDYAVDGTKRMQDLIEGLLRYSRISTEKHFVTVDTNSIATTAIANLEQTIDEAGGEVTCDQLPTVEGDEVQLVQLFQNLIGNGLKYRKPGVPPHVHLSARQEGKEWIFAVKDNGIGIAPQHFEKVFQIFQRLHTKEEYPGTGIGLASCKKIVERHGGRIWIESNPREGSTFYFTLPGGKQGN